MHSFHFIVVIFLYSGVLVYNSLSSLQNLVGEVSLGLGEEEDAKILGWYRG